MSAMSIAIFKAATILDVRVGIECTPFKFLMRDPDPGIEDVDIYTSASGGEGEEIIQGSIALVDPIQPPGRILLVTGKMQHLLSFDIGHVRVGSQRFHGDYDKK